MLKEGLSYEVSREVTYEETAANMGSGDLEVFSTPSMIALMEFSCRDCVAEYLEEGQGTVGIRVDIQHLGATPVGMKVTCRATLKEIQKRKLIFEVECSDEEEVVGRGIHERFIIDNEKFMKKINAKINR